jgi:hypothetical protein
MAPRRRPLSPIEQQHLRNQVKLWLLQGVIEPSPELLEWVNNTVFVTKSNGSIRVCVDCTPVNAVTKDVGYPLPRLQDLRYHLVGAK